MNGSLKCYCNLAAADSLLHIFLAAGVYLSYHIIVIDDNKKTVNHIYISGQTNRKNVSQILVIIKSHI